MFSSPGAIAFQLGPLVIRWYGILMATSIVVGLWMCHRQARREGLPADDIISVSQWAILAGLVGARTYEVIFMWAEYYSRNPIKVFYVWEGGLAMHGGLIVGPLVGIWLARRWGVPILRGLDVVAPSFAIGQAIGRWGNFFNEEAFGRPTDLPWKLYISPKHRLGHEGFEYFHPTFLYESLWDLAVFFVLVGWLRPRLREQPGALFFAYIGLYSIGRFAIEQIRLDSFWLAGFRVAQLASLLGVIVALVGLMWTRRRAGSVALAR